MPPTYLSLQFYYKRDWCRCFPANFAKSPRTPVLQNTFSRWLLLYYDEACSHFGLHMRKLILVMAVICLYFTLNFFIGRNTQQYWQSLACYNNFLLYNKQKILVQFPKNCFDCKKHPVTKISTMFLIKAVEQLVVDHLGKWSIQLPLPLSPSQ